ncbi:hemerythrin domain-containing protein [Nocardia sp. NBC_00565]|uniref:hemerythrin domain-containing protein n=1 Tax=Nocardia sp. NBC_00565 TaxID=2975993 RepID=UPI002E81FF02|nr:hemerythrin domain-containing protein [Nocardia sp. NBC_00565]WUC06899.1 hemerythrin domain-containing protein [Nocardia sp. NBC_00565]
MGNLDENVIDLLTAQHEQIRHLLDKLKTGEADKRELFTDLVRLLAVHETAEEEVVHPVARRAAFGADDIVRPRLDEENHVKRGLAELYDLGVDHPDFDKKLSDFADAFAAHAAQEESEEFPFLRKQFSVNQLERWAGMVRAAERLAPTRPHPHAGETGLANLVMSPPLAVFDRVRDVLRDLRHRQGDSSR